MPPTIYWPFTEPEISLVQDSCFNRSASKGNSANHSHSAGHGAAMDEPAAEYEHTLAFAEIAFAQIKALREPATPRKYEIWYTYATGYNPLLNHAINDALARKGTLTDADLEQVYANYISPTRLTDRIGTAGSLVVNEINQVMSLADASAGSALNHTERLNDIAKMFGSSNNREDLHVIIQLLLQTMMGMKKDNQVLEERLNASGEQFNRLQQTLEAVRNESLIDPLTRIANRKHFDDLLVKALAKSSECSEPLSLVMIDIDHFKSFNGTWGHLTGDHVLRLVATSVRQNIKSQDLAARCGGDEFAVILPNTVLRTAHRVADHMRRAIMSKELTRRSTGQNLGRITASLGVAVARSDDTPQSLVVRADATLYAAKRNGRNRVVCETDPEVAASIESKVA